MCWQQGYILFWTASLAKGILLGNLSAARVCFLAIFVKEKSNFGNSCIETQNSGDLGLQRAKNWQFLSRKCQFMALLM